MPGGQLHVAALAYAALFLGSCLECAELHAVTGLDRSAQSSSSLSSPAGVGQPARVSPGPYSYSSNPSGDVSDDTRYSPTVPNYRAKLSHSKDTNNKNNTSTGTGSDGSATVERPSFTVRGQDQDADSRALVCAYMVLETGGRDELCFRATLDSFECQSGECLKVRSPGGQLVANVLSNGSVLVQWGHVKGQRRERAQGGQRGGGRVSGPAEKQAGAPNAPGTAAPGEMSKFAAGKNKSLIDVGRAGSRGRARQGGFKLSCWWNGSYTQFECAGALLGASCRDYWLNELHESVPYRICLRPLLPRRPLLGAGDRGGGGAADDPGECVEFTVSPLAMQNIVIAMTTVGGAICVMLVIICLLVAYITEYIMSPVTQHAHAATRSQRSACTHSRL